MKHPNLVSIKPAAAQDAYFAQRGIEAWRQGEVSHDVTSNPTIAISYAEIVVAFWRDRQRLAPHPEPLTICELGAGSARFAVYFLRRLDVLCEEEGTLPRSFRYVPTDAADANLKVWRRHPCFDLNPSPSCRCDPRTVQAAGPTQL